MNLRIQYKSWVNSSNPFPCPSRVSSWRPGRLVLTQPGGDRFAGYLGQINDSEHWGTSVIRVLLADDEHLVRGALVELLRAERDLKVVADTGVGSQVLHLALTHRPDVAVLDVNLSDTSGIQVAGQLHEHLPSCRTLLLTSLGTAATVREAMELGVNGYLMKDAPPADLATAIRRVAAGHRALAPELVLAAWETRVNPLTPRETEMLRRAADGQTVSDIADAVRLSAGTVRNYLGSCITKLGARSRLDAVRIAREAGWLPPPEGTAASPDRTQ